MKIILLIVTLLIVCGETSYAGGTSAELYDQCHKLEKSPTDAKALISDVSCTSYIDGVVDGYRIVSDLYKPAKFICLPADGLTNNNVIEIFTKWLQKNPNENATPARSGILLSLRATYPCK